MVDQKGLDFVLFDLKYLVIGILLVKLVAEYLLRRKER